MGSAVEYLPTSREDPGDQSKPETLYVEEVLRFESFNS